MALVLAALPRPLEDEYSLAARELLDMTNGRFWLKVALAANSHSVLASHGRELERLIKRRRELARMLCGRIDEASLAHARELLTSER